MEANGIHMRPKWGPMVATWAQMREQVALRGSYHTTFRRRATARTPQGHREDAIPRRLWSLVESNQSYSQIQRNEETRYEYPKDIGQDLARLWPKGLAKRHSTRDPRRREIASLRSPCGLPAVECRVVQSPVGDLFSHFSPVWPPSVPAWAACGPHWPPFGPDLCPIGLIWGQSGLPWTFNLLKTS